MQNKFCKTCGQANVPQVTVCAKCGARLAKTPVPGSNPFDVPSQSDKAQSDVPPATVAYNAQSFDPPPQPQKQNPQASNPFNPNKQVAKPPPKQKNNKMLWIAAGIGGILVVFIGVVAIVGIGSVFYLNSGDDTEVARDNPIDSENDETKKSDDDDENDLTIDGKKLKLPRISSDPVTKENKTGKYTDAQMISFVKGSKARVGKFKLESVKPLKAGEFFSDRDAGITALYASGSKRILHNMSMYSAASSAKSDFEDYVDSVKSSDAKIERNEKGTLIYRLEDLVFFVFCNDSGGCHQLASKDGKDLAEYYDSYFTK